MAACHSCGSDLRDGAPYCVVCGTATGLRAVVDETAAHAGPPAPPPRGVTPPPRGGATRAGEPAVTAVDPPAPPSTPGPAPDRGRSALVAALVVVIVLIVVGAGLVAFLAVGDHDVEAGGSTTATAGSSSGDPGASEATPSTTPIVEVEPGLFCATLRQRGYSYAEAVLYWHVHHEPPHMDEDRNDRPCETAYPSDEVAAFWAAG